MRLLRTELTPLIGDLMQVDLRSQPFLSSPFHAQPSFHAHPELELVFIIEGFGKRIIGNKVERFESGDMVFIGSNVPHLWLSDPVFYEENSSLQSKVIVTYFNPKLFQELFNSIKEFKDIHETIQQSSKGIRIFGETRNIIADELLALSTKQGFDKVHGLLKVMNLISISQEKNFINNEPGNYEEVHSDRLADVVKFMKENLHQHITLHQVADIACLTEQSFCRYFKKKTKKSFSQFLNDLRISQAKELLLQTDNAIADIAYLCGFNSSSHFCSVFKDLTGESPLKYKLAINKSLRFRE